jgi:hypothetical protein
MKFAEPVEFERIAITIPTDMLQQVDLAARLYRETRSGMIQRACRAMVGDLVGVDWIKEIVQEKEVKLSSGIYDLDKLISRIYDWAPSGSGDKTFYLSPPQVQFIKAELDGEKTDSKKSKWQEFCEKLKLDPENIPADRPVLCVPSEEAVE